MRERKSHSVADNVVLERESRERVCLCLSSFPISFTQTKFDIYFFVYVASY